MTGKDCSELMLKAHMIIMDFFTLQMPGILNRLSVSITYQPPEEEEVSISFGKAVDWWLWENGNLPPKSKIFYMVYFSYVIKSGTVFSVCYFIFFLTQSPSGQT